MIINKWLIILSYQLLLKKRPYVVFYHRVREYQAAEIILVGCIEDIRNLGDFLQRKQFIFLQDG